MFDLFNVRLADKEILKLVKKNNRYKQFIWHTKNIITSQEKWWQCIDETLNKFTCLLQNEFYVLKIKILNYFVNIISKISSKNN